MATLFKVSACIRTDLFGNLKSCRPPEQFFDPVPICQSGLCTYANYRSYRLHNWDWKQFMGETDLMQAMARTLLPQIEAAEQGSTQTCVMRQRKQSSMIKQYYQQHFVKRATIYNGHFRGQSRSLLGVTRIVPKVCIAISCEQCPILAAQSVISVNKFTELGFITQNCTGQTSRSKKRQHSVISQLQKTAVFIFRECKQPFPVRKS